MVFVKQRDTAGEPYFLYNSYLLRPTLAKAAAPPGQQAYLKSGRSSNIYVAHTSLK